MHTSKKPYQSVDPLGSIIAVVIISAWTGSLVVLLNWEVDFGNPWVYLAILFQMHLYTGLFITAHDAMHGSVSRNRTLNNFFGGLSALLFSFNFYGKLLPKHHEHHRFVATDADPDYHEPHRFWPWYWSFVKTYLHVWQFLLMVITFWLMAIFFPLANLLVFWALPAVLSTFQLFYFGTFLPHRGHHANKHQSGTLPKNHLLAFFSCYFFGYHYEHHDSPGTPWWRLWQMKE